VRDAQGGYPPTRVFSEKRLQTTENKGSMCGITAKERTKRPQSVRNKELKVFGAVRLTGPNGYFMGYYTIWLAFVKKFFHPVLGISSKYGFNRAKEHRKWSASAWRRRAAERFRCFPRRWRLQPPRKRLQLDWASAPEESLCHTDYPSPNSLPNPVAFPRSTKRQRNRNPNPSTRPRITKSPLRMKKIALLPRQSLEYRGIFMILDERLREH
jgi:hypothetical protein